MNNSTISQDTQISSIRNKKICGILKVQNRILVPSPKQESNDVVSEYLRSSSNSDIRWWPWASLFVFLWDSDWDYVYRLVFFKIREMKGQFIQNTTMAVTYYILHSFSHLWPRVLITTNHGWNDTKELIFFSFWLFVCFFFYVCNIKHILEHKVHRS